MRVLGLRLAKWGDERVLKLDCSESYTTLKFAKTLNCTLKMSERGTGGGGRRDSLVT